MLRNCCSGSLSWTQVTWTIAVRITFAVLTKSLTLEQTGSALPTRSSSTIISSTPLSFSTALTRCAIPAAPSVFCSRTLVKRLYVRSDGMSADHRSGFQGGLTTLKILTGAQIPLSQLRNDAVDNLLGALWLAGHYIIPVGHLRPGISFTVNLKHRRFRCTSTTSFIAATAAARLRHLLSMRSKPRTSPHW